MLRIVGRAAGPLLVGACCRADESRLRGIEARLARLEGARVDARETVRQSWAAPVLTKEALYTEDDVEQMVRRLAADISRAYADVSEPLVLVGLLDGVFVFLADLSRRITVPHEVDFVAASSYGSATVSSGNVRIKKDATGSVQGKHVLIIDEMCDSGRTLASLAALFSDRNTASVRTCVLLDKVSRRVVDVKPDFVGSVCEDHFVVGYGMDWGGKYRSLPFVGVVRPELYRGD